MFSDRSPEAFLDALSKGKGRTVLALQNGDPSLYTDAILHACVENLQFDRQFEENRRRYVLRLLGLAGLKERARESIFEALPSCEEERDHDWMVDLLSALADDGDAASRQRLVELAARDDERAQDRLAELDDEGLQWVEEQVIPRLAFEDRWRIGMWLPDDETDDSTATQRRLRAIVKVDDAARDASRPSRPKPKPTAKLFLRSLDDKDLPHASPYDFAQVATMREWRLAARRLLRETDSRALRRLAQAFKRNRFPLPARKLFRRARHPERGGAVMAMLGTLDTPAVRRFALGVLRCRPLPWNAIEALRSILRPGDEPIILRALQGIEGESNVDRHAYIIDVLYFFDRLPKGNWQANAEWIYEHSPCSMCRASAVEWMAEHGTLPAYIFEEAPYDAESRIRKLGERCP